MGHNRVSEITNLLDDVADTLVLLGGDPAKADILKSYKNRNDVPIAMRDFFESIKFDVFIVRAWSSVKGFKELKSKCDLLLSMISNYQQSRYI
jgi:hypothetical protein